MTLRDLFADVVRTLWAHKLRSALTMFGIAWGVISIMLMVAAGEGLRVGQEEQTRNLGKNIMIVFSGRTSMQAGGMRAGRALRWNDTDIPDLQQEATSCQYVLPELGQNDIRSRSRFNDAAVLVTGSYPPFQDIRSLEIGQGRFYSWDDLAQRRHVAFLGSDIAKQLFPQGSALNENVYLNGIPFSVIGVMLKKKQNSSYDGWDVNKIFIPYTVMQEEFPNKPPNDPHSLDQIIAVPKSLAHSDDCKRQIRTVLGRLHHFNPTDKEAAPVWDTVEDAKAFAQMTDGMKFFLGAVGIVTLLLGGLGVMNVMLVAVRERTREIGVRKAIGAPSRTILMQFFIETAIIVAISGGGGLAVAYGLCALVDLLPMPDFFAGLLPTWRVGVFAVVLLGSIAIAAAMYPARRAASIDPIEALRYEAGG